MSQTHVAGSAPPVAEARAPPKVEFDPWAGTRRTSAKLRQLHEMHALCRSTSLSHERQAASTTSEVSTSESEISTPPERLTPDRFPILDRAEEQKLLSARACGVLSAEQWRDVQRSQLYPVPPGETVPLVRPAYGNASKMGDPHRRAPTGFPGTVASASNTSHASRTPEGDILTMIQNLLRSTPYRDNPSLPRPTADNATNSEPGNGSYPSDTVTASSQMIPAHLAQSGPSFTRPTSTQASDDLEHRTLCSTAPELPNGMMSAGPARVLLPGAPRNLSAQSTTSTRLVPPPIAESAAAATLTSTSISAPIATSSTHDAPDVEQRTISSHCGTDEEYLLRSARRWLKPTPALWPALGKGQPRRRWDRTARHVRRALIHLNPPPSAVPCVVENCTAVLDSPIYWLDHIEEQHVPCPQCQRMFFDARNLHDHVSNASDHTSEGFLHSELVVADNVDSADGGAEPEDVDTTGEGTMRRSDERSPLACDACDMTFDRLQDLEAVSYSAQIDPFMQWMNQTTQHLDSHIREYQDATPLQTSDGVTPLQGSPSRSRMSSDYTSMADMVVASTKTRNNDDVCAWPIPCGVCLETCRHISVLPCGHVGCRDCLLHTVARTSACPHCRAKAQPSHLRKLYLPGSYDFPPLRK